MVCCKNGEPLPGLRPVVRWPKKEPHPVASGGPVVLETEEEPSQRTPGGIALKKTLVAVLACSLLLAAATPAFAKKHHHKKHHHAAKHHVTKHHAAQHQ